MEHLAVFLAPGRADLPDPGRLGTGLHPFPRQRPHAGQRLGRRRHRPEPGPRRGGCAERAGQHAGVLRPVPLRPDGVRRPLLVQGDGCHRQDHPGLLRTDPERLQSLDGRARRAQATGRATARGRRARRRGGGAERAGPPRTVQGQGAPAGTRRGPGQAHERAGEAPAAEDRSATAAEGPGAEQARAEREAGAAVRRYGGGGHPAAAVAARSGGSEAEELLARVAGGDVAPAGDQAEGVSASRSAWIRCIRAP
ncbi:Uncharacterised protein [Pseudomonas aeruginosa]|nr:Uncharacterised protein [Pseudomonas aeruginosa]